MLADSDGLRRELPRFEPSNGSGQWRRPRILLTLRGHDSCDSQLEPGRLVPLRSLDEHPATKGGWVTIEKRDGGGSAAAMGWPVGRKRCF